MKTIKISNESFEKLQNIKNKAGIKNDDWDKLFSKFFDDSTKKSVTDTIEKIFEKNTYDIYFDAWIKNFSSNLENIWKEPSVRKLISSKISKTPAIIIGRGPSLKKNKHLELLAKSKFNGPIICCDSALEYALKSGITPTKFKNFFVMTIDTQTHQKKLYDFPIVKKYGNKIKCILSTTVPTSTYNIVKKSGMKIFWVHALFDYNKGKNSFNYIAGVMAKGTKKKGVPAIQTGGNVGTSAWIVSWAILKHSNVALVGFDNGYPADSSWKDISSFKESHRFPKNLNEKSKMFEKAYPTIFNPEFNTYCKQDPIFQYYSSAFKKLVTKTPKWVKTINATEGGALFGKGFHCMKFNEFLKQFKF